MKLGYRKEHSPLPGSIKSSNYFGLRSYPLAPWESVQGEGR